MAGRRTAIDAEAVDRLFDPDRDPLERVRPDDWHPDPDSGWPTLNACDTVAARRGWYEWLEDRGDI